MYLEVLSGSEAPEIDNKGQVGNENPGLQTNWSIYLAQANSTQTVTVEQMTKLYINVFHGPDNPNNSENVLFNLWSNKCKQLQAVFQIFLSLTVSMWMWPASTHNQLYIGCAISFTGCDSSLWWACGCILSRTHTTS